MQWSSESQIPYSKLYSLWKYGKIRRGWLICLSNRSSRKSHFPSYKKVKLGYSSVNVMSCFRVHYFFLLKLGVFHRSSFTNEKGNVMFSISFLLVFSFWIEIAIKRCCLLEMAFTVFLKCVLFFVKVLYIGDLFTLGGIFDQRNISFMSEILTFIKMHF